jgi:hypothetical protein
MKTITVPAQSSEINALLDQARHEEVIVRTADGSEFMLVAIEEFDEEIARTRKNPRLMALLDERARQTETIAIEDVRRELGLSE